MNFVMGEQVLAKPPSSTEYERGKVMQVRGDKYKVQFKDGAEHTVSASNIRVRFLYCEELSS